MRSKQWIGCETEADYFGDDRKHSKVDRKRATAKDRSKYKKTDRDQKQKQEPMAAKSSLLRGRVLSITPQGILVEHSDQTQIVCALKGTLKQEKQQLKNLVTVGDFVLYEEISEGEGVIFQVEPRHSTLSRADNLSRRKEQLIAANIDQVLITMSVVSPPLKPFLVDRYIIATLKGNMTPIIVINKIDLLQSETSDLILQEQELYNDFVNAYSAAGIKLIPVSTTTGEGLDKLREAMRDKASVFSGQSGVGKTSLINSVAGFDLKIGHVVTRTQKGAHTTTTASLLPLPFGGWCIDTPGIKSFGIWDLEKDEIQPFFPEIFDVGRKCKYPNCTHMHEKDCAVINAVENGEISALRYQSYIYLMDAMDQKHLRR